MDRIKAMYVEAYDYLMKDNPTSWSRHRFNPTLKCDILLNNMCESFNAWVLPSHEMPVLSMMEWIRRQLMNCFNKKQESMVGYMHKFTLTLQSCLRLLRRKVENAEIGIVVEAMRWITKVRDMWLT